MVNAMRDSPQVQFILSNRLSLQQRPTRSVGAKVESKHVGRQVDIADVQALQAVDPEIVRV
jgi:hypothetical protein